MSENTKALGFLPPLGWNSWNTFTWDINESLIFEIADCMVKDGYKDAGYEYLVIDDCWSLKERDENGHLVADPKQGTEVWYVFLRRHPHLCRISGKL